MDISADIHLIAASLKGHAVAEALGCGGNVQVVDAAIDGGTDYLGAVLGDVSGDFLFGEMVPIPAGVAVFPVAAEANLGSHQVRLA
jgi:hypothetical protein